MAKEILFNIDARDQLKKGIDTLANAVKVLNRFVFPLPNHCKHTMQGKYIWNKKETPCGYLLPTPCTHSVSYTHLLRERTLR